MKQNTKSKKLRHNYDEYDEDEYPTNTSHKKGGPRRRPVRNWKKAWVEHQKDYDEVDDFFSK